MPFTKNIKIIPCLSKLQFTKVGAILRSFMEQVFMSGVLLPFLRIGSDQNKPALLRIHRIGAAGAIYGLGVSHVTA